MNKRQIQNTVVITAAIGAAILAVYTNTNWPVVNTEERERCYGIVYAGKNDCGNARHACAAQSKTNADPEEFIMAPKGLCERIARGKND